ncbi:MAG: L,D-transpeptidase family protein [Magnetospirillum sp.]|nr:L,D-transpeptidase family protein [Magnetospirillum sp.]
MSFARSVLAAFVVAASAAPLPLSCRADEVPGIQRRLEEPGAVLNVAGRIVDAALLRDFYGQRGYRPAWSGRAAEADGDRLIADLQASALAEGLPPEAYSVPPTASDADRDLLVSDAIARLGRDLALGRVPPSPAYGGAGSGAVPTSAFDPAGLLSEVAAGQPFLTAVARMDPQSDGYRDLQKALVRYRDIARTGGWPLLPEGPALRPGQADARVHLLRLRLMASGDLPRASAAKGNVFDHALAAALRRFQERHGLAPDGTVGKDTLAALDVTAETRVDQIEANLERRRWMPRPMEPRYIVVNIPAQTFELHENGTVTLTMRVIVGDPKHPTPGMTTSMTAVIVNPSWTVPASIATKEILPKLRRDPNYLAANNMRILGAFPESSPEAEGIGVDWRRFGRTFPYRIRQRPGPDNALGRLKFYLTQSDAIYLHDTPQKSFFKRDYRALSHGCVRLEKPLDLAGRLLGPEAAGRLDKALAGKATRTLRLDSPVPVHLVYRTAWADPDGTVHFREDIYGHDARLAAALKRPRPHGLAAREQAVPPL